MPASPSTAVPPALAARTAAPALRTSSAFPAPPPQEPATQPLEPQPPRTAGGYSTRYSRRTSCNDFFSGQLLDVRIYKNVFFV